MGDVIKVNFRKNLIENKITLLWNRVYDLDRSISKELSLDEFKELIGFVMYKERAEKVKKILKGNSFRVKRVKNYANEIIQLIEEIDQLKNSQVQKE